MDELASGEDCSCGAGDGGAERAVPCRRRGQADQLSRRGDAVQRADRRAAHRCRSACGSRVQGGRQGQADLAEVGHGDHGGRRMTHAVTADQEDRAVTTEGRGGILDKVSDFFFAHPKLLTLLLLLPPLLWIGVVYVGSLFALLLQSFYSLDDYSGLIVHEFTLSTYAQLLETANLQIILRTVLMSASVTLAAAIIAFP